jgi:cysteine desulfurase/selenocysteine lyase
MINSNIKSHFPIFKTHPRLVYLDSAATALKPQPVIDAVNDYYQNYSANVFRGLYALSEQATQEFEKARATVAEFIHASSPDEVIFTRSTTESLNLIAYSWGRLNIKKGDAIATTIMEHHSNFVPWQQLVQENAAVLKIINLTPDYQLNISRLDQIITKTTKLLTLTHVSNVLGTLNPVKHIIRQAKKLNPRIITVVDGAQAVPHLPVDVQDLGCDLYCFSGHKLMGPTGIGILWGKKHLLEQLPPFQFGGEMIEEVYPDHTTFKSPPHKFEAGTPHIAGAIGLAAAINYLSKHQSHPKITLLPSTFKGDAREGAPTARTSQNAREHWRGGTRSRTRPGVRTSATHPTHLPELQLIKYTLKALSSVPGLTLYGSTDPENRSTAFSFTLKDIHPHDLAQVLDSHRICIRSGHHCTMPLHQYLGIPATARASLYFYNTPKDIDKLADGILRALKLFS